MRTEQEIKKMLRYYATYLQRGDLTNFQIVRAKSHVESLNWTLLTDGEFVFYDGEFTKKEMDNNGNTI
jgi:hypothetical protein